MGASPGANRALQQMNAEMDVRHVLPAIRVPTLILHSIGDRVFPAAGQPLHGRADPGSQVRGAPGRDHLAWGEDADAIVDEIEEFLTGVRHGPSRTVCSRRSCSPTSWARRRGPPPSATAAGAISSRATTQLVRRELGRFRGREIDTTGDGFLATFDGPARAVRCARAVSDGVRALGLDVRAGLHTGEIELVDDKVSGLAVHIGARVAAAAGPGEILVSSTVKDLVAGSGLRFQDRGSQALKGVPGQWHLFALAAGGPVGVKRICVFCGSALGRRAVYADAARALAAALLDRGARPRLRRRIGRPDGDLADAVLAGGGEVIGVLPKGLRAQGARARGLTELHVVASMHERKALMATLADGFVALPGRPRHARGGAGDPHVGPARHPPEARGPGRRRRLLDGAPRAPAPRRRGRLRPTRVRDAPPGRDRARRAPGPLRRVAGVRPRRPSGSTRPRPDPA